jgi:molybdenum cofactor cytidylyltransferase
MTAGLATIVLAAGLSRRWGTDNKLTALIEGRAMVARAVEVALAATARPVIVVLGHEPDLVCSALEGLPVVFQTAPDFAAGMSASLKAGIAAVPEDCDGALICLGDMPWVRPATLDYLGDVFGLGGPDLALVPTYRGEWGNPVLLGRALFPDIARLTGDRGARALLAAVPARVREIPVDDPGILRDADQPSEILAADPL